MRHTNPTTVLCSAIVRKTMQLALISTCIGKVQPVISIYDNDVAYLIMN